MSSRKYTLEEDGIIRRYYPEGGWQEVIKLLPYRSSGSIIYRARYLKVKFLGYKITRKLGWATSFGIRFKYNYADKNWNK